MPDLQPVSSSERSHVQALQAFGLIGAHPTLFATPLVIRLFRYLKLPTDQANCLTLRHLNLGNPKFRSARLYDVFVPLRFSLDESKF